MLPDDIAWKASVRASEKRFKRRARRSVGSPARPRSPAACLALDRGCPPENTHLLYKNMSVISDEVIAAWNSQTGFDATAYLTCYLRLTFGQNDLPDGLLLDSTTYPAAYLGPKPRGARGAAPDRGAASAPRRGHAPSRTSS